LSAEHAYGKPGIYQVTVAASDTQHREFPFHPPLLPEYFSNSESQTIVVSAAPITGSTVGTLSAVSMTPTTFVAALRGPSATAAASRSARKAGAAVHFVLTRSSRVTFSVGRLVAGLQRGRRCVPQHSHADRSAAKKCTVLQVMGSFVRGGTIGKNTFRFTGRLDNRVLKTGAYLLIAKPIGANQPARRVKFHVLASVRS